jgi:cell division protein FtsI/penicillin-binding protein 2
MLLVAGVVVWSIAIVVRLVQIQVYRAEDLADMARRQHSSTVELDPMRGTIFDRTGAELAIAKDVSSVYAVPAEIESLEKTATALSRALKLDRRKVLGRLRLKARDFVWIERKVSAAEAAAVAALHLPGIAFVDEPKRFYPRGSLAAHVLGYVGLDNNGLGGIEQQFDAEVRGIPGIKLTLRDARGLRFLPEPGGHPAEPGRNVVLALDAAVQHVVERELRAAVVENQARGGVAIVLDPWTGDVLALAGEPTFDPNNYLDAEPEARRNRAVQEAYEPGSTFKVVTLTAAVEGRHVRRDEPIDCGHGSITLNGARVTDHDPFDLLTPTEVLAHSSNVGAIVIGSRVPAEDFYRQVRRFGFGKPTGIDLPGEAAGILRPPESWSGLSKPMMSMGYEVAVTPIQLAAAFAALANGGTLVKPRLVLRIEEQDGRPVRTIEPVAVRRVASPATVGTLSEMLEEVVRDGTATAAAIEGVTVAGKTGTAKKLVGGVYTSGHYVASFGAFAPARRPRVTVLVALDEPRAGEYYGGRVAAPVVRRILVATLAILGEPGEGRTVSATLADYYPGELARTATGQKSVLTWNTR